MSRTRKFADEIARRRLGNEYLKTWVETRFDSEIKKYTFGKTNKSYLNRSDVRVARILWPPLKGSSTNILLGLDKFQLRLLIGAITGHCMIGKLEYLIFVCKDVEELKTIDNVVCHCPRLNECILKWLSRWAAWNLEYSTQKYQRLYYGQPWFIGF